MTIAAGFCYDGGILLCADSQYTGAMKVHQKKLFPMTYGGWHVVFGLAGNEGYAKLAVQESQDAIRAGGPSVSVNIRNTVSDVLRRVYAEHIDPRPYHEQPESQISLLVAAWSKEGGLHLYASRKTALIEIDTYECIGAGDYLAHYIVGPLYSEPRPYALMAFPSVRPVSRTEAVVLALEVLSALKSHDPTVGGQSELIAISSDGWMTPVTEDIRRDVKLAEEAITNANLHSRRLIFDLMNPETMEESIPEKFGHFELHMRGARNLWKHAANRGFHLLLGKEFAASEVEDTTDQEDE